MKFWIRTRRIIFKCTLFLFSIKHDKLNNSTQDTLRVEVLHGWRKLLNAMLLRLNTYCNIKCYATQIKRFTPELMAMLQILRALLQN